MSKKKCTGVAEWADRSVNFLKGCKNNCVYCYAAKMANRFGWKKRSEWDKMQLSVKMKGLPRNSKVMFPTSHDLFPEHLYHIKPILEHLLERGNTVLIVSKPRKEVIETLIPYLKAIMKDLEIDTSKVEFRFSITSATDAISLKYEPGAPLPQERVDCLKMVLDAGFPASVSMEPYLEDPAKIFDLLDLTIDNPFKEGKLKEIWLGAMNYGAPPELRVLYTKTFMGALWEQYRYYNPIRFKDSFQKALGIDCHGGKL